MGLSATEVIAMRSGEDNGNSGFSDSISDCTSQVLGLQGVCSQTLSSEKFQYTLKSDVKCKSQKQNLGTEREVLVGCFL